MKQTASIKQWSEDDRPREKLLSKGPAVLSHAELLAILINSGTRQYSALDLAKMILAAAGDNLRELGRLSIADLMKVKGIGEARAITITAALELGRRRQIADGLERTQIRSADDVTEMLLALMADLTSEVFVVLYLNNASMLIKHEIVSHGGLTGTIADIRLILKQALELNANRIIVAHNHPSGNLNPSMADKQLTLKLKEAAALMDIQLLDHVIVAGVKTLSMVNEGFM